MLLGLGYIAALVIAACAILILGERVAKIFRRQSPGQLAEAIARYEQRLLSPDWAFYEQHLARPIPAPLRRLFEDRTFLLRQGGLDVSGVTITSFEPLDAQGMIDTKVWVTEDVVAFARSEADPIYLRSGADEPNKVYITYHDGGETAELSPDITEFIAAIERQASEPRI